MRQNLYSSSLVVSSRLPFSFQWCFILLALSILTATIPRADAATTNVVIDDTHGDQKTRNHIIYDPPASWIASSLSGSNTAFSANDKSEGAEVDLAQIFEKTWHEGVFTRNSSLSAVPGIPLLASATFFGTSVTVVCVIDTRYHTDLSFTLDRESIDKFYRPPTFSTSSVPLNSPFEYGVVVFKKDNLRQTNHTLTIQSGRTGGQLTPGSKLMLDYITYSFEDDSPDTAQGNTKDSTTRDSPLATSASGGNNAAQIAGGIIGAFLGLAFIGLVIIIYRRKQQNRPLLPTAMKQLFDGDKSPPKGEMNQGGHRGGGGTGGFNANLLVRARTLANRATSSIRSVSGSGRRKRAEPLPRSHSRPQTTQVPGHGSVYPQHNFPTPGATPLLEDDMPLPAINTPLRGSLNSTRMESIQAWSRQTSLQAQDAVRSPRSLAGESEALESFYDDNATESRRIKTPPPTRKVFAVMNN